MRLRQDNKGKHCCDWGGRNNSFIHQWNNNASTDIVEEHRYFVAFNNLKNIGILLLLIICTNARSNKNYASCRAYDQDRTHAYNEWYRRSTRTLLTAPPPPRTTQPTRDEQLHGGFNRSLAYVRDMTVLPYR